MGRRKRGEVPAELVEARDRFGAWRQNRQGKSRIPEPLWALAVKMVTAHGLRRTASILGLDYCSLKKRVESAGGRDDGNGPVFFELPAVMAPVRECVLEFEDGTGVNLRVQLKGYDAADVVAVGRGFRSAL